MQPDPIVTVTPTVMDGLVVRWYADLDAAQNCHEMASASRNGVRIASRMGGNLYQTPAAVLDQAIRANEILRRRGEPDDEVRAMATHRRRRLFGMDLEPIHREEPTDAA